MSISRQCLRAGMRLRYRQKLIQRRVLSSGRDTAHETDSLGIPLRPTWSVNDLLTSYPTPSIDHATLQQLHKLAALKLPEEASDEYIQLKGNLEELVRLVEAVKLVETSEVELAEAVVTQGPEDDWKEMQGETLLGRELLKHAHRTKDAFYVVDTDARQ